MIRLALALLSASIAAHAGAGPLRFRVCLEEGVVAGPASGRLLIFLYPGAEPRAKLGAGFLPGRTWIAAQEVARLAPGVPVEIDPDVLAYPQPLSKAPRGTWQMMALLDRDHSYAQSGMGRGDLYSAVKMATLDPSDAGVIDLCLSRVEPGPPPVATSALVQRFETPSRLLAAFWGRPVPLRAGVVLPPSYETEPDRFYPVNYIVHPFAGSADAALRNRAAAILSEMRAVKRPPLIHVFLDASFTSGHHAFADSVNNGPWSRALIEELIPALEQTYRIVPRPGARFLTGHSSGGWSTLWLQINYPDQFGGVWSTGPDPVDFRRFTGIDASPGSKQNAYRGENGDPVVLMRWKDANEAPILLEQFVRHERVLGSQGGQYSSFEWVFSPRGPDGRPMPLFDRDTGVLDPAVQKAWRAYDINVQVRARWRAIGPKLRNKIRIIVGGEDNFRLNESAESLCEFLEEKGHDGACEIVPGRDHIDLYRPFERFPGGLDLWIAQEMMRKFESTRTR